MSRDLFILLLLACLCYAYWPAGEQQVKPAAPVYEQESRATMIIDQHDRVVWSKE